MTEKGVTLYFVRHGETYLNSYGRIQGWSNAPLTDKGIIDARRSGKGLKDIKFDAVYTSDLLRTIDTAELLLEESEQTDTNQEIILMSEFREVSFGSFEGDYASVTYKKVTDYLGYDTIEEMMKKTSEFDQMKAIKELDPYGHAENFMDFWQRVQKGLVEIIDTHRDTGKNILIVAHGKMIRLLLQNIVPELKKPGDLLNVSVSVTQYKNGMYQLDSYGDVSHFVDEDELDN